MDAFPALSNNKTATTARRQNLKHARNNFRHLSEATFLKRHFCGFVFSDGSFSFFPILFGSLSNSSQLPVLFIYLFIFLVPTLVQLEFPFLRSRPPNCCCSGWINAASRLHRHPAKTDILSSTGPFGIEKH